MKLSSIVAVVIGVLGLSGMLVAFLNNASPYVTIAEAKSAKGDNLHVAGDLVKETVFTDTAGGVVRFDLKDEAGGKLPVVYHGLPPANMGNATKVVAVGGMKDGAFHATKLLIKCPSKYESTQKVS